MSDGTVRGTFDLNTDPSLQKLRALRASGRETTAQMHQLGDAMDHVGGPTATRRLDTYRDHVRDVGRAAVETATAVDRSWESQRKTVDRQATIIEGRVDRLEQRVQRYGRTRATATVELRGAERVNLQLAELERRLDKLSRQHASPSVGLTGGFSNLAGGGGGGGGGAVSSATGGGGGGIGFAGKLALGGALLSPGIQALGVSATGLVGSAIGATLGSATVLGGGAATLGVGGGLTYAATRSSLKTLQEVQKAELKYKQTVERYGANTKQAAVAREALTRAAGHEPQAAVAAKQIGLFSSQYRRETAPARSSVFSTIGNVAVAGRTALPNISRQTNAATAATGRAVSNYAGFLAGGQSQSTLAGLTQEYVRDLPYVERGLQHVTSTVEHLAMAARPFFHEGIVWAERWTATLDHNTGNEARMQHTMRGLVQDTKDWGKLAGATFHILRDIFNMGRPSGDSMVVNLTHTLDRWDSWIQRNPAKVERFFNEAQTTTEKIAGALTGIVRLLSQAATAMSPIFNRGMDLIKLASALGPTGTTVLSALAYGGYGGLRGGGGGSSTRSGALIRTAVLGRPYAPGAASSTVAPGGGVLIGPRRSPALVGEGVYNVRPRMVATAAPGGGFIVGPAPASHAPSEVYRAANTAQDLGPFVSIAQRERGLGAFGSRVANSRIARRVGSGITGAGKTLGLTMAAVAALEALGKGGSAGETVQNFGSSFTLGLLHPSDNTGSKGVARASKFLEGIPSNYSPVAAQAVVGRKIQRVLGQAFTQSETFSEGFLNTEDEHARDRRRHYPGMRSNPGSPAFMAELQAGIKRLENVPGGHSKNQVQELQSLRKAWKELSAEAQEYRKQRNEALDLQSEQHALKIGSQLGGAYNVETSHGRSKAGALTDVTGGALSAMKTMRERGRKILGESTLAWAHQLAKGNPELEGVVNAVTEKIKRQWHNMGRDISIVNGHILTGSKSEWEGISTAMSEPLERARERMSKSFTAIQKEAVGSLMAMGFSAGAARQAVGAMESGGLSKSAIGHGVFTEGVVNANNQVKSHKGHARGGMIGGTGLMDTVPVPGGMAAPGEAWIANRHTLNDISRATVEKFGKTAQQMIAGEHRLHWTPPGTMAGIPPDTRVGFARGGQVGNVEAMIAKANAITARHYPYLWGGGHNSSFSGPYDCSGAVSAVLHAGGVLGSAETSGSLMSWGQPGPGNVTVYANPAHAYMSIGGRFFGTSTSNPGGGAAWFNGSARPGFVQRHIEATGGMGALGGGLGGAAQKIHLRRRSVGMAGVPGLLADSGIASYTGALTGKVNNWLATMGGAGGGGGGTNSSNERLGKAMMIAAGWPASEWPSLQALWQQESGWNANSVNSSSGAYGIPQALGHGHPFNLGDPRAQIAWGLNYIRGRYGSPSAAEAHERSSNWYARGGQVPTFAGWHAKGGDFETRGPTIFGAGEKGKERVSIRPLNSSASTGHHIEVHIHGGSFSSDADIEKTAQKVAAKIIDALDEAGTSGSDRELIGR